MPKSLYLIPGVCKEEMSTHWVFQQTLNHGTFLHQADLNLRPSFHLEELRIDSSFLVSFPSKGSPWDYPLFLSFQPHPWAFPEHPSFLFLCPQVYPNHFFVSKNDSLLESPGCLEASNLHGWPWLPLLPRASLLLCSSGPAWLWALKTRWNWTAEIERAGFPFSWHPLSLPSEHPGERILVCLAESSMSKASWPRVSIQPGSVFSLCWELGPSLAKSLLRIQFWNMHVFLISVYSPWRAQEARETVPILASQQGGLTTLPLQEKNWSWTFL